VWAHLATTTHDGLDENRELDLLSLGNQVIHILVLAVVPRNDRHASFAHDLLGFAGEESKE